ncbi:MAG: Gfo/Idh/MocA family protein [Paracoccaceae bacterium]
MTRAVVIGLGYFSQFHLTAWQANSNAELVGVCDLDADRAGEVGTQYGVRWFTDVSELLKDTQPDIVDIVAPPAAHAALIETSLASDRILICQKPFCRSIAEAETVIAQADTTGTRIVVHENFRFQPWYRTVKTLLDQGRMGQVYGARFALRPGDGRGPNAYLDRQPFFQTMPRLLIHETAVHFIDLFRWLLGDITSVYADLRRLNPVIAGEDAGALLMHHESGAQSLFDGNRLTDHVASNPRKTMGVFELTGEAGTLALDGEGVLRFREFQAQDWTELPLTHPVDDNSFGGGCVAALIDHVIAAQLTGGALENEAADYIPVMRACEAAYHSHAEGRRIDLNQV